MGFRQLLLLVPVAASLVNCQKYPGTDSVVFTSYDEGRNSSKVFHTVNIIKNESSKCNEDKTQRCNLTTGWSGSSPIEEKKEETATSVKQTSLEGFTQTTQLFEESTSQAFQPTIPTTIRNVVFPL